MEHQKNLTRSPNLTPYEDLTENVNVVHSPTPKLDYKLKHGQSLNL